MFLTLCILFLSLTGPLNGNLRDANESLQKGENTTSYEERKENLNQALFLYHTLSKEKGSSDLDRTIADIYFQLGEYPWSILYYEKTLKIDPSDSIALEHLKMADQKLGLAPPQAQKNPPFFNKFFSWIAFNIPLLLSASLLAFAILSLSIWIPSKFFRKWAGAFALCFLFLLMNSVYFYYTTPLEGILILSSGFYSTPSKTELQSSHPLIFAGTKVTILQMTSDGEWLKVKNGAGSIGFIPANHLRII